MNLRTGIGSLFAFVCLLTFAAPFCAGETNTVAKDSPPHAVLGETETDTILQGIFDRAETVTRIEALMITTLEGGVAKRKQVQYADVKFAAPSYLWKLSRDDSKTPLPFDECSLVVFDGTYLWELQPAFPDEAREATRRTVKKDDKKISGNAGLAVFLLRSDVRSVRDIRKEFKSILCETCACDNGTSTGYHFTMVPANKAITIELWFRKDGTIPYRVRTTRQVKLVGPGMKASAPVFKTKIETRDLQNVKTNLTGLPAFLPETFLFPWEKSMALLNDETADPIDAATVQADLAKIRQDIETEWKKPKEKTDKQETEK